MKAIKNMTTILLIIITTFITMWVLFGFVQLQWNPVLMSEGVRFAICLGTVVISSIINVFKFLDND